jgi:hypothetical protein
MDKPWDCDHFQVDDMDWYYQNKKSVEVSEEFSWRSKVSSWIAASGWYFGVNDNADMMKLWHGKDFPLTVMFQPNPWRLNNHQNNLALAVDLFIQNLGSQTRGCYKLVVSKICHFDLE